MEQNLNELVRISRLYGQNPEYVIAGGGNTSYKNTDKIWVKSSGSSMANIIVEDFVCLDRKKIQHISVKIYSVDPMLREQQIKDDLNAAIIYPKDKRPSVETSLHEVIQYSFIVHTHPTMINGLLCACDSKNIVRSLFGSDVLYMEYTDPGYVLFKAIETALEKYRAEKRKEPSIIFLENHGVFVAANSTFEVEKIYNNIVSKITKEVAIDPDILLKKDTSKLIPLIEQLKSDSEFASLTIIPYHDELAHLFLSDEEEFKQVSKPFTPDNIVYCKSEYLYISDETELPMAINTFKDTHGYIPKIIGIRGKGILAIEENPKAAQIVLDVYIDMIKISYLARNFGGPRQMSQKHIEFIDNWEVENYRRKMLKN